MSGDDLQIWQLEEGAFLHLCDDTVLFVMHVPRRAVQLSLQAAVGGELDREIVFCPLLDGRSGGGATLRRSLMLMALELSDVAASFGCPDTSARVEDFVARTMVCGLHHNFSDLIRPKDESRRRPSSRRPSALCTK
jgi:hypothetical protein